MCICWISSQFQHLYIRPLVIGVCLLFSIEVPYYFILIWRNSLYILNISPLLTLIAAKIFSPTCHPLLTLSIYSYWIGCPLKPINFSPMAHALWVLRSFFQWQGHKDVPLHFLLWALYFTFHTEVFNPSGVHVGIWCMVEILFYFSPYSELFFPTPAIK